MDARAPAVVAVVVTRDPGPWFEETLEALARQDYGELSVLVLVSGGEEDPTDRVARLLPEAFVRRLPEDRGFGAAANEALAMVEGAAFFLLCHDDCAPDPDAVHLMVEESFRSNAGIVAPKMVRWDDPSVLLHVGMNADKTGAVVDRVQAGEVDHGQHDAVRDVFVAPGGCTLVRADLFRELGGYDPGIVAMGEDLDLSWRSRVAGARVVVAPGARARHLQALAGGLRDAASPGGEPPPSLQERQRRNELRVVLKAYGWPHLLRVLPQALVLAVAELAAAALVRDRGRARAVGGAWRWNLRHAGELRVLRRTVRRQRTVPDADVRRLQLRGSARFTTYASRLAYQGFDVAHGLVPSLVEGAAGVEQSGSEPVLTGSVGQSFSENADFDELDDLGRRAGRDRFGRRVRRRVLATRRARFVAGLVTAAVLVFGSRGLLGGALPLVGQFAPLPSWTATWHQLFAGWQPAGLGTTAPSTPAFGVMGVVATLLFGGMGLTHKVLVLGCLPAGAWGMARLLRGLVSPRARLAGALAYLGLPLAYDALSAGRWDGLVAYAVLPFVLARLIRATGLAPFGSSSAPVPGRGRWAAGLGPVLSLGVVESLGVAFAPAVAVDVVLCALGIVVGSLVVGEGRRSLRALGVAGGATVVTALLCGPWVVGTLLAGTRAVGIFGLQGAPSVAPTWGALLRFAVGPIGGSPLGWLLVAAALLPLLIARDTRLAWAGRLWGVAVLSWLLALLVARGWSGSFAPSLDVVLAPAAAAVAACVGLGVGAFEVDLHGFRFGWRQGVSAVAAFALVLGLAPVLVASFGGRWGLPSSGYGSPLAFMGPSAGGYRVLWLGDPRALPLGGWSMAPGLAYATSEGGLPTGQEVWAPAGPGPSDLLAGSVSLAMGGETAHLGALLAPAGVRYVVVAERRSPADTVASDRFPPSPALLPALGAQTDLRSVPGVSGLEVFVNVASLPERAQRGSGPVALGTRVTGSGAPGPGAASSADLSGWRPVLEGANGGRAFVGPLRRGDVLAAYAPAGRWRLSSEGSPQTSRPAFGWAVQFPDVPAGQGRLYFAGTPLIPLAVAFEALAWAAALALLASRRRRRPRQPVDPEPVPAEPDAMAPAAGGGRR